jgi:hypothetical protein|tara:strand:+ start:97 stop:411 length:315 start_codon:yes stop_codon:yes gene_type:complete
MKNFITTLFLFSILLTYSQDITVVHFNYKWNSKNDYVKLESIKRASVSKALVEEQSADLQASIKAVPVIIIFRKGKPVARIEADLSMKIKTRLEDIQELVDRYQ